MTNGKLDQRATDKVAGPAWDSLRPAFNEISDALLSVGDDVSGELTTIYIKYAGVSTDNQPFGVVWVKTAKQLTVGLALPDDTNHERLIGPPKGFKYAGLTKYLVVDDATPLPDEFGDWCRLAYESRRGG